MAEMWVPAFLSFKDNKLTKLLNLNNPQKTQGSNKKIFNGTHEEKIHTQRTVGKKKHTWRFRRRLGQGGNAVYISIPTLEPWSFSIF